MKNTAEYVEERIHGRDGREKVKGKRYERVKGEDRRGEDRTACGLMEFGEKGRPLVWRKHAFHVETTCRCTAKAGGEKTVYAKWAITNFC